MSLAEEHEGLQQGALADGETLEWRVYLARRQPARATVAVGVILGVAAWGYVAFGSLLPGLAGAALLLGAVGEFLFPVTYRLSPEYAEARGPLSWRRIAWKEVKRVYAGDGEIKLSPLAHPGPREAFRGVLLRCEANQEAVLAAVKQFRDAAAGN